MNREFQVNMSIQAEAQLSDIVNYIASELKAPDAALHVLDKLQAAMKALEYYPQKVALIEEEPWHSQGVHKLPVLNYLVYFWIDKAN